MDATTRLGLKMPNFYRTNGNYEKLQLEIDRGRVLPNSYVYDSSSKKLIFVNDDKTYNFIGGDADQMIATLIGTPENPVQIATLFDGIYIVQGNYEIRNTDVEHIATAPIMVFVEADSENSNVVHATVYTSNGFTIYSIGADSTTIDRMITEETVAEIVSEVIGEQITEAVEDTLPEVLDDNIRPASDQEIDDMIDDLFPDVPTGGGGN